MPKAKGYVFVNKDYEAQAVNFTFAWMDSSLRVYVGITRNTLDKVNGFLSDILQKENIKLDWAWFSNYADLDNESIEDYFLRYYNTADSLNKILKKLYNLNCFAFLVMGCHEFAPLCF